MGTFIGHILPGCGFFLLGLWHLYNILTAHSTHKQPRTWYPLRGRLRHGELYFILVGSAASIAGELLPDRYRSVTTHLNNFEHATISLSLLLYAAFALVTDLLRIPVHKFLHAAAGIALSQELLLFHFHSSDHMGLEGQYHRLLQLPVAAGVLMLLLEILHHAPVVSILRSMSFLIQGVWLVLMGFVLWTPAMVPEGCYIAETDHVDCPMPAALMQAKSLANLEFAWVVSGTLLLTMAAFVAVAVVNQSAAYHHLEDHVKLVDSLDEVERGGDSSPALMIHSPSSLEMQAIDRLNLPR